MTIGKSIIIVILLQIISIPIGLTVLLFDIDSTIFPHVLGLLGPTTHLLANSILLIYFWYSKDNYSIAPNETKIKTTLLIFFIILLAIGEQLFALPFFRWKQIANTYFGTAYLLSNSSNYELSLFRMYHFFDALILAPFFEELIFRYYLFGGLLKKYSLRTAMLTSSILFSLTHIDSPRNLIPTFIFGMISATVYYTTKKIHFSIAIHFIANLIWAATIVFAEKYDQVAQQVGVGGLFWLIFLAGGLILAFTLNKITTTNST